MNGYPTSKQRLICPAVSVPLRRARCAARSDLEARRRRARRIVSAAESRRARRAARDNRERSFADVRMAWAPGRLAVQRPRRGQEAAALVPRLAARRQRRPPVWIDTRATLNIHRASRLLPPLRVPARRRRAARRAGRRPAAHQPRPRKRPTRPPARVASCEQGHARPATRSPPSSPRSRWAATTRSNTASSASPTPSSTASSAAKPSPPAPASRSRKTPPAGRQVDLLS